MNMVILLPRDYADGDRVRLTGPRLDHVRSVLRARSGDELRVGLLNGSTGTGRIARLDDGALEMDVHLDGEPPASLPVTIVLALPRPKVMRRVLFSLTVMGVKRIILTNAARVEKSYWQTPFLHEDAVRRQLVRGLEQAGDTILPEVLLRPRFKPFVEDELEQLSTGTVRMVAHPDASRPCSSLQGEPATLAVGPEGGFVPYEIEKLLSLGFSAVTLGPRILNVETALASLIARTR